MLRITSIGDIAGQVTAASHNADRVTAAAVCLPSGALTYIRRKLPKDLPKWRNATDETLSTVVNVLGSEVLGFAVCSFDKRQAAWTEFWSEASEVHAEAANESRERIGFVRPANLLKFLLFGQTATAASASVIRNRTLPYVLNLKRRLVIEQDVILDSDLEGRDNIEALSEIWRSMNRNQPLTASLGIDWTVSQLQIATEQREPLIHLPDYVAGLVHAASSDADTLRHSAVTSRAASSALQVLRRSPRFVDLGSAILPRYFDIFPEFKRFLARRAA